MQDALARPDRTSPAGPGAADVSVVVAAYNEAPVVRLVVGELAACGLSVVVVDDGSSDGTAEALAGAPVHLLRHAVNLGQGAALQTGLDYALASGARSIVTFDADGQHCAADIPSLLAPLRAGSAVVVLGSRFLPGASAEGIPPLRRLLLRAAAWFTRATTGLPVTDVHNGLRAFTREAAAGVRLTHNGMSHASELLEQIARRRLPVVEVPVHVRYTAYSLRKGQKMTHAFSILWEHLASRLSRR